MQPSPQTSNRRLSLRRKPKSSTRAACRKGSLGLGPDLARSVLDVSESGARLVIGDALPAGQEVEVALEGMLLRRPVRLLARVVWCVPLADGGHCVGVRFDKLLPHAALQALVSV